MKTFGKIKPVRGIDCNLILTKWQKVFLKAFASSDLKEHFNFSGGTALSGFYLEHRLSDGLDFFSSVKGAHSQKVGKENKESTPGGGGIGITPVRGLNCPAP